MAIEGFDYKGFAENMSGQAGELVPTEFTEEQKRYVVQTLHNFSNMAGEALYNDTELNFNADQAVLLTQIIAEWSFHKSIDLIKSGLPEQHWDTVMKKVAFTIFEIGKQAILQNIPQEQLLGLVEHHVKQSFDTALEELESQGLINDEQKQMAANQSNIDNMVQETVQEQLEADRLAEQVQETQAPQEQAPEPQMPVPVSNTTAPVSYDGGSSLPSAAFYHNKTLKLASVALLLKNLSQDKIGAILNKFSPMDADSISGYMKMEDLENHLDATMAIRCLKEIKVNLPVPKNLSAAKLVSRIRRTLEGVPMEKVEMLTQNERPFVKKFIFNACDGDYLEEISPNVADVVAQYVENSV